MRRGFDPRAPRVLFTLKLKHPEQDFTMSQSARLRGIEMAFDDTGRGAPVVLLHGFPFNRTMWRGQVEALSATHRVIAPDLRGMGETSAPSAEAATMAEMAEDVSALLDELGVRQRVVLGALSMGGYVALAFCRKFPHRVRALVLADTRAQADDEEGKRKREETARRALSEGMTAVADAMLPKLLAPATREQDPALVERVREMILKTKPVGAAAALRGMARRPDQTDFLQRILAPALILVGSEDQITPPDDSEVLRREIRGSRLEVLDGAAHLSNLERPAEFNRALETFLGDIEP